MAGPKI